MRTQTLCNRIEKKINQKFAWLKVASINISHSTVSDYAPLLVVPYLFEIKVSLNRNGLVFKKVTFKILNEYHRIQ
jgi:hypothetical protein